ncbi:hypothetical protein [Bacillus phage vB_BanS-Thrax1]|nr:hypothetical protein [Bacillus phage vB_BanS-Thrax1]
MYKHISKNSVRKHKEILEGKTVELFTMSNNYKGGQFGELAKGSGTLKLLLEDLQEGFAVLVQNNETGKYIVRYAGKCKWVVQ